MSNDTGEGRTINYSDMYEQLEHLLVAVLLPLLQTRAQCVAVRVG